jgi:hypothetical protein
MVENPPLLAAIKKVLKRDNVTFAELSRLEGFAGDFEIHVNHEKVSNIVIWSGLSQEAMDALEVIRQEGEYSLEPTSVLTYLMDGVTLNLPLAKSVRHYKKPHWAPAVLKRRGL